MTTQKTIVAVACAVWAVAAVPAAAQTVQEAQRNLFICMRKADNLQLKDEKKKQFIDQCVEDPGKPVPTDRNPT